MGLGFSLGFSGFRVQFRVNLVGLGFRGRNKH